MTKNLVEQLKYVGGNDEGLGGYCEALIIRVSNQKKHVLHRYGQYFEPSDPIESQRIKGKHEKVEFSSLEEMLKKFPGFSVPDKDWKSTNRNCGYKIPKEEFQKAHDRRFEK